ncbi:pyridoxamine 5'-phosphate oxidase family protein [Bacillus alveayuensis]|uniref:pyridoxamine 5'-phosphate oxidase family protein n=1 Tax=Aeribacillus alveayuensis TaxID=279215 RepID=UPI0005D0FBED|nr:pyridoxamine 5'-phosphate oxidase family protein [Bacillus alveayuensis]
MKTEIINLTENVIKQLQGEKLVFAVTTSSDNKIYSTAISWLVAVNGNLIRFAISPKSPLINNVKQNPNMQILLTIPEHTLSISGSAIVQPDPIPDMPFPMCCVELHIERVDDIMFYGGVVTSETKYKKTYPAELSKKLDSAIYKTLSKPE